MNNVTAYYIVKNENKWIRTSIELTKKHVSDILVVDTGSEDNTVEEVKKTGVKLIECPAFEASRFSEVKNHYAKTEIATDLILYIDGNEIITDEGFLWLEHASSLLDLTNMELAPFIALPQYEVFSLEEDEDEMIVGYYDRVRGRRRLCNRHRVEIQRGFGHAVMPRVSADDTKGYVFSSDVSKSVGMFWHMRFMGQSTLDGYIIDHMNREERNRKALLEWSQYPKKVFRCDASIFTIGRAHD